MTCVKVEGAYRLPGTGTVHCSDEIIDVGCNLKQSDGLTWLTLSRIFYERSTPLTKWCQRPTNEANQMCLQKHVASEMGLVNMTERWTTSVRHRTVPKREVQGQGVISYCRQGKFVVRVR